MRCQPRAAVLDLERAPVYARVMTTAAPIATTAAAPEEYTVLMLGTKGAGKTTFLASLYKCLRTQGDVGYFLKTASPTQQNELQRRYQMIADPNKDWPAGTTPAEDAAWGFSVSVNIRPRPGGRGQHDACRFSFYDYAGGRLTDDSLYSDEDFQQRMENASALFILVDGAKMLRVLEGHADELEYTLSELGRECECANNIGALAHPVDFLLTKWDLLEAKGVSLDTVRNKLLEVQEVHNIVNERKKAGLSVRLIPVSSVGSGFVRPLDDGTMQKIPGKQPHPFLVETAFACVIMDAVHAAVQRAEAKVAAEQKRQHELASRRPWWKRVFGEVVDALSEIVNIIAPKYKKLIRSVGRVLDVMHEADYDTKIHTLEEDRKQKLGALQDEHTALEYVITCMGKQIAELEHKFPASRLA